MEAGDLTIGEVQLGQLPQMAEGVRPDLSDGIVSKAEDHQALGLGEGVRGDSGEAVVPEVNLD